jgi:hypothetical protein
VLDGIIEEEQGDITELECTGTMDECVMTSCRRISKVIDTVDLECVETMAKRQRPSERPSLPCGLWLTPWPVT